MLVELTSSSTMTSCSAGSLFAIAFALSIDTQVHGAFVPVSISENLDHDGIQRGVQQTAVTCGGLTCLNGGTCAQGHDYNITAAVCDCAAAFLIEEATDMKATQYVGRTCEIEVNEYDYCPGNADLFCVNGGTCRSEAENFREDPCDCNEGFKGRHCEYKAEDVQEECDLSCSGKGKCEHGFNPIYNVGANEFISMTKSNMTTNFMHCVCEEGFAGPGCEFDYIKCDGRGVYCFHGSICGEDGGCNCTAANDFGWAMIGLYCEYKATDSCDSPKPISVENAEKMDLDPSLKMNQSQNPFCVNDALCYKIEDVDEFFCYCEAGTSGKHCETVPTLPTISPAPSPPLTESPAPTTMASVTDKPAMETGMTNKPTAKRTGAGQPTWPPTRAPIESFDSQAYSDEDMEAGAKAGIVLAAMFGVVLAMGITLFTLRDPPARLDTTNQGNTGEQVLSENNTQGSQSQDGIPENIHSEANVTTTGDDVLPAVV